MPDRKAQDVILTFGNDFKGDDGAGTYFGSLIHDLPGMLVINGGDSPENNSGAIQALMPERIVIVDALNFGGNAGEWTIVPSRLFDGASISTHGSFGLLVSYLAMSTGAEIFLIGIQPESIGLGDGLSISVKTAVEKLAARIMDDAGVDRILEDERHWLSVR